MKRLVVLASGNGSNLQAMLDASDLPVVAVVSNRPAARALERARQAGIPALVCERAPGEDRRAYDRRLAVEVARFEPDWVVLAGWMHVLSLDFLQGLRVINLHPALPGTFPGLHAIERAFQAGLTQTGVMVHLVPDEGVDDGPVLATRTVPILPGDTLEDLTARVHGVEHELLVETLRKVIHDATSPAIGLG